MDHDLLASEKQTDLDLHCFQNRVCPGFSMVRVKAERWTSIIKVPNRQIFAVSVVPDKSFLEKKKSYSMCAVFWYL